MVFVTLPFLCVIYWFLHCILCLSSDTYYCVVSTLYLPMELFIACFVDIMTFSVYLRVYGFCHHNSPMPHLHMSLPTQQRWREGDQVVLDI